MGDIRFPARLTDLSEQSPETGFYIDNSWDVSECNESDIHRKLEGLSKLTLKENFLLKFSQNLIDDIYSMITGFQQLSSENKRGLVETLCEITASSLSKLSEDISTPETNAVKIIIFFLSSVAFKIESSPKSTSSTETTKKTVKSKSSKSNQFDWNDWNGRLLDLLQLYLEVDQSRMWAMSIVQDAFLSNIWNTAVVMLDNRPGNMLAQDKHIKSQCIFILIACVKLFNNSSSNNSSLVSISTAFLDSILRSEHMATSLTDVCSHQNYDSNTSSIITALNAELMQDISQMNMSQVSSAGVKNIGVFLENFGRVNKNMMVKYLPIIMNQLDSPIHQIRSSLLSMMGSVVIYIHETLAQSNGKDYEKSLEDQEKVKLQQEKGEEEEVDEDKEDVKENNPMLLLRTRETLLDILIERVHDVSFYTRGHVLKIWSTLTESHAIPVRRYSSVAEIGYDRLHDKTAAVRRQAIELLIHVIDNNPFAGDLYIENYESYKKEIQSKYNQRYDLIVLGINELKKNMKNENENMEVEEDDEDMDDEDDRKLKEEINRQEIESHIDIQQDNELIGYRKAMEYYNHAIEFIRYIDDALVMIIKLLRSKTASDVVESLRFFEHAVNFSVKNSAKCLRSSFSLIWHQDNAIRNEVLLAFRNVFLTDGSNSSFMNITSAEKKSFLNPMEICNNLIELVKRCDQSEIESLEKIIGELFLSQQLDQKVIQHLWNKLTQALDILNDSNEPIRAKVLLLTDIYSILQVICIVGKSVDTLYTTAKINLMIEIAFHPVALQLTTVSTGEVSMSMIIPDRNEREGYCRQGIKIMKVVCQCLQSLPDPYHTKNYFTSKGTPTIHPSSACITAIPFNLDKLLHGIHLLLFHETCQPSEGTCDDETFLDLLKLYEECIITIFYCSIHPEKIVKNIITGIYRQFHSPATAGLSQQPQQHSRYQLVKFLYLLGQTASSTLLFSEKLFLLTKIANQQKQLQQQQSKVAKKQQQQGRSGGGGGGEEMEEDEDVIGDEMGMTAAEDAEQDKYFHYLTETQIVCENLLGQFHPMIAMIISYNHSLNSANKTKYSHPLIRQASTMALCRYMSISAMLCERYLPLLFTILERDEDPSIRTTIIVTLGDLAFRFPNSIEPWTNKVYERLTDSDLLVRYNTLMVLSHLILHDMIKVKGHVSQIILCLCDTNEKMRELSTLFFVKLSERSNNPIYNLLGDIIGSLSLTHEVTTETSEKLPGKLSMKEFQSVMTFLLSFVKKDKQADGLLERLLIRLSMSTETIQKQNLAFCISELSITEKGARKLIEMMRTIKDALYDPIVFDSIRLLVNKTKKSTSKSTGKGAAAGGGGEDKAGKEEEDTVPSSSSAGSGSGAAGGAIVDTKSLFEELDIILDAIYLDATGGREVGANEKTVEELISAFKQQNMEDGGQSQKKANRSTATRKMPPATKATRGGKAKTSKRKKSVSDDEMDVISEEEDSPPAVVAKGKGKAKRGGQVAAKTKIAYSDDEDEEFE